MKNLADTQAPPPVTIHIVYPLLRGSKRFKIERGRRWSVVEHLLLRSVRSVARSAEELEKASELPRRVIVEAFTRLMRAGWVEIVTSNNGTLFRATEVGKGRADLNDLPPSITPDTRWITYYIDDVTNCVFRWRDVVNRNKKDLPTSNAEQYVHLIPREGVVENLSEIFRAVEGANELIVGAFPNAAGLAPTFGVITFRNGAVEGFPKGASKRFAEMISSAYAEACAHMRHTGHSVPAATVVHVADGGKQEGSTVGLFDSSDLIVDARSHKDLFEAMLRNAQERVIIHSTFVTENAEARLPAILYAASKGVRVDLFWGQSDEPSGRDTSSQVALKALKELIASSGYGDFVRIHQSTTESHAKFIVSNDKRLGWMAVLGSCNWLGSAFDSFEASLRMRDKLYVGELVNALSMMSVGRKGIWNETAQELAALSRRIIDSPDRSGRRVPMRLLYTGDHAAVPIDARDRCNSRAFVTSHRIGVAGKAVTLYPLISRAQEDPRIQVSVFYGRTTGALSGADAADIAREYASVGLSLRPVHRPRLHAKVIGWDSDSLAVSSFNWLSVDPSETKRFRELGVFVEAPRIADSFINSFESAQWG